jgi:hypothetical protein
LIWGGTRPLPRDADVCESVDACAAIAVLLAGVVVSNPTGSDRIAYGLAR